MAEIKLSKKARSLKTGIYQHYKGKKYKVLGIAVHSETLEEMVLYKAMYGEKLNWVRPLRMFFEKVDVEGKKVERFRLLK